MKFVALLCFLLIPFQSPADPVPPSWDEDRLAGFAEHKGAGKIQDRERLKGKTADTEEREQWERDRLGAIKDYKKQIKVVSPQEFGPEHKDDVRAKKAVEKDYDSIRKEYSKQKAVVEKRSGKKRSLGEEEELGLTELRPRYDLAKRVMYGAKAKFKPGSSAGGGSSGGGGGNTGSFPPPPSFDEFPPGDGYVPPPPPMEEPQDFPPPPPPMPEDGGFGGPGGGEFPPPPPPGDFGDFPPPPMPAEGF